MATREPDYVLLRVRVHKRTRDACKRAGDGHYHAFVQRAIQRALARDGRIAQFRELRLSPRGDSSVDRLLEWLLSRQPLVADLVGADGVLSREVRVALYEVLPRVQARRVERFMEGVPLEEIGNEEGCSRQAVWASVNRAVDKLGQSERFVIALCAAFPDSDLTPAQLLEASRCTSNPAPATRSTSASPCAPSTASSRLRRSSSGGT